MARVERANSRTPRSVSNALTARLTAAGSISNERAAPTKLLVSTARTKIFISCVVVRIEKPKLLTIAGLALLSCNNKPFLPRSRPVNKAFDTNRYREGVTFERAGWTLRLVDKPLGGMSGEYTQKFIRVLRNYDVGVIEPSDNGTRVTWKIVASGGAVSSRR